MIGAAVTGCIVAATVSGVSAQDRGNTNGRAPARVQGSHVGAGGQLKGTTRQATTRQGTANQRTMRQGTMRQGMQATNGYGSFGRDRFGYGGPGRDVGFAAGAAADGYGWNPGYDDNWAPTAGAYPPPPSGYGNWAPAGTYRPLYGYAPGYDIYSPVDPYYGNGPGYGVGSYSDYDYAPGFSIGVGPVGIGFGPAWGW
jgi:hypothetical protein